MLVELSVMEQRYQAVLAVVQDGWTVTEVAERLGVSRQSVHAWIARYEAGGLAALADRSHRPASCPHQIAPELEARICELRREHPGWGPRRLEHELARRGCQPPPSRSSIYRCLKRHRLIELRRRRKRREEFRRWQRERPMELWQMDVMAGVLLDDGTDLKLVTGVDDHSRFCVACGLVHRAVSRAVCDVLLASLERYGIPDEILTDNGKVFSGRYGPRPAEVMFDRILREQGIAHRLTGVRSPTTTGKIERFQGEPAPGVPRRAHLRLVRAGPGRTRRVGLELQHGASPSGARDGDAGGALPARAARQGPGLRARRRSRRPRRAVDPQTRCLERCGLGRQPAVLGLERLQGRARRRLRRCDDDPGLEQEPPDQDGGAAEIRSRAQGQG